ncbi:MAG: hypothetical protein R3Y50_07280 [Rikenellaceae bacterium]
MKVVCCYALSVGGVQTINFLNAIFTKLLNTKSRGEELLLKVCVDFIGNLIYNAR